MLLISSSAMAITQKGKQKNKQELYSLCFDAVSFAEDESGSVNCSKNPQKNYCQMTTSNR